MSEATEDLEDLLHHPGFLRLKAFAATHWGDQLANHMRSAVSEVNDSLALQKMRQIIVAKDAVDALLKWPEEQIARQKPQPAPSLSRGGI